MRFKISNVFFMLLLLLFACNGQSRRDEANLTYLYRLNQNLLSTIDMLTTFNDIANNMGSAIDGAEVYSHFLMESAFQTSQIIQMIRESENLGEEERESAIVNMMVFLQPHEIEMPDKISKKQDRQNLAYLNSLNSNLDFQLATLLKELTKEEKIIAELKKVTPNYFRLHSHFFLFSVLKDFAEPQSLLSRKNRHYLVELSKAIENSMVIKDSQDGDFDNGTQPTGQDSL